MNCSKWSAVWVGATLSLLAGCSGSSTEDAGPVPVPVLPNEVIATPPARVEARVGEATEVVIHFKSSDGRPASQFTIDPASLPAGWTQASGEPPCATVGSDCAVPFTFLPTSSGSGEATIGFSYRDPTGATGRGSVSVATLARADYLFIGDRENDRLRRCRIDAADLLVDCETALDDVSMATGVVIEGRRIYVAATGMASDGTPLADPRVVRCDIADSGLLSGCVNTLVGAAGVMTVAVENERLWASSVMGGIVSCPDAADMGAADCVEYPQGGVQPHGMVRHGNGLYFATIGDGVHRCQRATDGTLSDCRSVDGAGLPAFNLAIRNQTVWLTSYMDGALYRCAIDSSDDLVNCIAYAAPGTFPGAWGIAVHDDALWLPDYANGGIKRCAFVADDTLAACTEALSLVTTGEDGGLAGIALP